jgi:hypothetical protein
MRYLTVSSQVASAESGLDLIRGVVASLVYKISQII